MGGAGAGVFAGCQQGAKPEGCFEDYRAAGLEVPRGQGFRGWVRTHKRLFRREMISDHLCAEASSEPDITPQ